MSERKSTGSTLDAPVFQWLGTAGFRVRYADEVILIDPFLIRNKQARPVQGLRPPDLADADYIFLSHGHFDHIADVPEVVRHSGADVYCSPVTARTLEKLGVPAIKLNPIRDDGPVPFEGFNVDLPDPSHSL